MKNILESIVCEIESYCKKNNLNHRFVGSISYGGLLNKKTFSSINVRGKTVTLFNSNPLSLLRSDNSLRDIDLILFCDNLNKITKFKQFIKKISFSYSSFPLICVEATIYPNFGKRNKLLQMVTSLETDEKNNLFLAFDNIKQVITWKSVEPWTLILNKKISYTTRNPIADYFAYQFRSPSGTKPKDKDKVIFLKKLSEKLIEEGQKNKIDYLSDSYFENWQIFLNKLEKTNSTSIFIKKQLLKYYWLTIGTYLAHGKGVGKLFLSSQNQFTGIKQ